LPVTLSPLRYPGGKTQMAPFVSQLMALNNLNGTYCEPFAGGCGIAWYLLLNDKVEQVAINDLSSAIFSFWHAVLEQTDALCERIESTEITIEQWHQQKEVLANVDVGLDLAFATLFLNRVNRSGILKAGVIGGKAQAGKYKLDCRFNKASIVKKIQAIAAKREQVVLTNLDANEFLSDVVPHFGQNILINIDPPYYNKGKELYQNYFEHEDHVALYQTICSLNQPWMVTYDNTPEIKSLYQRFNPRPFSLNYSAQVKRRGQELVIYSPSINVQNLSLAAV